MAQQDTALHGIFQDVARFEPPTEAEEKALVLRVAAGDPEAEAELVAKNLRLVVDIARRYQTPGATMEDLIQEGAIGLVRAARKFDPARGFRFSTFAHWWIRQGISRFVKGPTRAVRLPEYLQDRIARALKARRELTRDETGAPKDEVVGEQIGMSGDEVKNLIRLSQDTVSLEAPVNDSEGLAVGNTLVDESTRTPEDEADYRSRQKALVAGLRQLPARQTKILAYRFGLADGRSRSRPWIGKQMGLSAERIRQIEKTALKALRKNLGVEGALPEEAAFEAA